MTTIDDRDYYVRRAEQERRAAAAAETPAVRAIHLALARGYPERLAAMRPVTPASA